ncbi:MAG: glycosyltransferase [Chitinophagaceae bacterium]
MYQYFLPAYKAGGPIQSIANMCRQLGNDFQFYIICSNKDVTEKVPLQGIKPNEWNNFENGTASIFYISDDQLSKKKVLGLIEEIHPDLLFINGLYSLQFSIIPLLFSRFKKILSVRGMLHPGALSQKSIKKKFFLSFLKATGMHKALTFHATNEKEKEYIKNEFGKDVLVKVAQNFPVAKPAENVTKEKNGILKMISIGLISPMKNHALVLQALKNVRHQIVYDIYGPVKDEKYWQDCLPLIQSMPDNITINYKGSLPPDKVLPTLSQYNCFILPSKSENFGHAIYESLLSGVPVITSQFTPWNNLKSHKAGWNVDIEDVSSISNAIEEAYLLSGEEYASWSSSASAFANKSVDIEKIKKDYQQLFS